MAAGIFLCRGAVYHPSMAALKSITDAALMALLAFPAAYRPQPINTRRGRAYYDRG